MELRQPICEVIDMIADAVSQRLTEREKDSKTKLWHIGLNDITDEQIWVGLSKFAKQPERFFPTPGQFREYCISTGSLSSVGDEASEAWSLVMENLNAYKTTIWKNTLIAEAIRQMGGWGTICKMLEVDKPYRKIEFVGIYQSLKRKNEEFNPLLEGQFSNYRNHIGFKDQKEIDAVESKLLIENETVNKIANL